MGSRPSEARATGPDETSNERVEKCALTPMELGRVRGTLHLLGVRPADIDDLVQDVQVRLLEHAGPIAARGAWCCAVAANLARDRARREIRWRALVPRFALPNGASADTDVALRESVRAGLARLPKDLRTVAVLRFYADLSVPEIAESLGVPEGTVKSRLHRAASQLRTLLPRESVTS
ncbi:MAG: sigma-70 family RNA polymerase sigma factor [Actinomycetota bacterium]